MEKSVPELISTCSKARANPHLSVKILTSMCAGCVTSHVYCVCVVVGGSEKHVCAHVLVRSRRVLAKSAAAFILMHGSIPSDLSIQKMNNPLSFFFCFFFLWCLSLRRRPSFSSLLLFQFSLLFFSSSSFFSFPLALYLVISSSPAV